MKNEFEIGDKVFFRETRAYVDFVEDTSAGVRMRVRPFDIMGAKWIRAWVRVEDLTPVTPMSEVLYGD